MENDISSNDGNFNFIGTSGGYKYVKERREVN